MAEGGQEGELEARLEAWRQQHQIRKDDPAFLLMDLFRIHQQHWEAVRQRTAADLPVVLESQEGNPRQPRPKAACKESPWIRRMVAVAAIGLAAAGGFMLGRGFH